MKENTIQATAEQQAQDTRENTRMLMPPVDIFETDAGLVVVADLPGVDKDSIDINVEKNVLTLKATPLRKELEGALRREYELLPFFRQFQLSDAVDQAKISAEMKYGVVTIHLPKVEEKQPRKVAVKVAGE